MVSAGVAAIAERGLTTPARAVPAHRLAWERAAVDIVPDIVDAVGAPVHVMYPAQVRANIAAFRAAFAAAGVHGDIYYAKKANKSACVVRACAESDVGVDVSSIGELVGALSGGVRGTDLMVTGPAKSDELLWLAARHDALIAVDSVDEFERVPAGARVLLRMRAPGTSSRFGLTPAEAEAVLQRSAVVPPTSTPAHDAASAYAARSSGAPVRLTGFSFHLSGYDPGARIAFATELFDWCARARALGHPVTTISIGGGFGVDYVPAADFERFLAQSRPEWFHAGKEFGSYYPYSCASAGSDMLTEILNTLGPQLRSTGTRLAVEPGRALLAHAGFSVFQVQGVKRIAAHGGSYDIATVGGTSLSLSEQWFASEYLPDPILLTPNEGDPRSIRRDEGGPRAIPADAGTPDGGPYPTCVGAATCLESDMLSWRKIPLPRRARIGDLLLYPNTAGYQMDSNESPFHDLPLPPKVVLGDDLRWRVS